MNRQTYFAIISVLLLALLLRLPLLNGSFWLDESAQAIESVRPLNQQLNIAHDFQPPLLHLVVHFASYFSYSEWWLRTIGALIPGLVSIFFSIKIVLLLFMKPLPQLCCLEFKGGRLSKFLHLDKINANSSTNECKDYPFGKKQLTSTNKAKQLALLTGVFLSINSFHLFYSQELRPYALPAMWAVISWYWLIKKLPSFLATNWPLTNLPDTHCQFTQWKLIGQILQNSSLFIICSIAGLYSSYLYPFVLIGQFSFLALQFFLAKKTVTLANLLLSSFIPATVIGLAFLPWLPSFLTQLRIGQELRLAMPNWETVVSLTQVKAIPLVLGKFFYGNIPLDLSWRYLLLPVLVSLLIIANLLANFKQLKPYKNIFLVIFSWLIIPLLTAWLISFAVPVIRPKRMLVILPAFEMALVFGLLLVSGVSHWQKKLNNLVIILLIGLRLSSIYRYYTDVTLQRENWRSLASEIKEKFDPNNTALIFAFSDQFAPWDWYTTFQTDGADKKNFINTQVSDPDMNSPSAKPTKNTQFKTYATGTYSLVDKDLALEIIKPASHYQYLLLFDYLRDLTDANNLLPVALKDHGYTEIGALDYANIGFVRIYVKNRVVGGSNFNSPQH